MSTDLNASAEKLSGWDPVALIEPELILPGQEGETELKKKKGEFGLLWAVFHDGLRTYCQEILAGRTHGLTYREVERWIFRPDSEVVTSFSNLCDLFGIDSRRLRRRLLHFRERPNRNLLNDLTPA